MLNDKTILKLDSKRDIPNLLLASFHHTPRPYSSVLFAAN